MQHRSDNKNSSETFHNIALLISTLFLTSGCAQTLIEIPADYHVSYNLPLQDQATLSDQLDASELTDVSAKIYLISDNQRHELLGGGANWFRNATSDNFFPVSIRPPQLDLFGQDLLREALATTDAFVLHLGDACDVSNTGEFGRFAWDMRGAPHGWAMAPGNHDGFFFGNSSRTREKLIREWDETGESYEINGTSFTSVAMQKDRYVSYYLAALILQEEVWSEQLAHALNLDSRFTSWTQKTRAATIEQPLRFDEYWAELVALQDEIYNAAEYKDDETFYSFELVDDDMLIGRPHVRRISWLINKEKVWQSFILQEIDISAASAATGDTYPISVLLIDTSHYGFQPSIDHGIPSGIAHYATRGFDFQVAGKHGNILDSQASAAGRMVSSMQAEGRRWMLASHHPYSALGRATPPRFNDIRDPGGVPVTLSGHTHAGEIRVNFDEIRRDYFLEINVGSILDSPIEFRDLQVHLIGDRLAVSSNRQLMENLLRDSGLLADQFPGYRPSPGDPDYYLAYTEGDKFNHDATDFAVDRVLLAAYLRMFRLFDADDPDQSSTYWPIGPDGTALRSHSAVTNAVQDMLTTVELDQAGNLNQFLYQLQEYDRTRRLTDASAERLRVYRISQAVWASITERRVYEGGTEAIDPDISFLILPRSISGASAPAAKDDSEPGNLK